MELIEYLRPTTRLRWYKSALHHRPLAHATRAIRFVIATYSPNSEAGVGSAGNTARSRLASKESRFQVGQRPAVFNHYLKPNQPRKEEHSPYLNGHTKPPGNAPHNISMPLWFCCARCEAIKFTGKDARSLTRTTRHTRSTMPSKSADLSALLMPSSCCLAISWTSANPIRVPARHQWLGKCAQNMHA